MDSAEVQSDSCFLVGLNGEIAGRSFPLGTDISIGRSATASIFLPDVGLARNHCRIEPCSEGYRLINRGRPDTVDVNGSAVDRVLLVPGDIVRIGRFQLRVESRNPRDRADGSGQVSKAPATSLPEKLHSKPCSGTVLTVRLEPSGNPAKIPALLENLTRIVSGIAANSHGAFDGSNTLAWRIHWRNSPQEGQEGLFEDVTRSAFSIQRLVFLARERDAQMTIRMGVAAGDYLSYERAEGSDLLWGSAVDLSLRAALSADAGACVFQGIEPLPNWLLGSRLDGLDGSFSVRAARLVRSGRRAKFLAARPVQLFQRFHRVPSLLIRVSHDPQSEESKLTLLTDEMLEIGDSYRVVVGDALPVSFTCLSSQVMERRPHHVATLAARCNLGMLTEILGNDVRVTEQLVEIDSKRVA